MKKVYIKRLSPLYTPWYKISFRWWYVAYGDWQPFAKFGHSGWIYLSFNWLKTFWGWQTPQLLSAKPK